MLKLTIYNSTLARTRKKKKPWKLTVWTLKETLRKFSRALKAEWESEPVGVGGALDLPSFWQTINPISTWGVHYAPNIIARPPSSF